MIEVRKGEVASWNGRVHSGGVKSEGGLDLLSHGRNVSRTTKLGYGGVGGDGVT